MKKAILLFLLISAAQVSPGQAPPKPCTPGAVNGSFETPIVIHCWDSIRSNLVPGWNTSATDQQIEMWDAACMGVPAYVGKQFAELNANMVSSLYEDICTPCPNMVNWQFAHRGRNGTDVCDLKVGPPGGPYTVLKTASDGRSAWGFYSGTYAVPAGQTVTRFLFESVSAAGGNTKIGNFLDAVNFSFSGFNVTTSQTNISCSNLFGTATVNVNSAGGPYTYAWSPTGGNAAVATGLGAGSYTVVVANAGGCSSSAVVNITSSPSGLNATNSQTNVSCFGMKNGSAAVVPAGGSAPYTYSWSTSPVQTTPNISNLAPGTYSCLITDASGCRAVQSVTIAQPPAASVSIASTPASCKGADGKASVTVSGGTPPFSYLWLTTPAQTTSGISNLGTGTYNVIITDANACTHTKSATIAGGSPPAANFVFTPGQVNVMDPPVKFTDMSSGGAYTWRWYFGDGDSSHVQHPAHRYTEAGTYCITLVVTDISLNCSDTTEQCLEVGLFTFYAPNAFTPNGDGVNDLWMPYGLGIDKENYDLRIFDRWGNLIFDTSVWGAGWDGRANEGREIAQEDVYVWKVKVKPEADNANEKEYMGKVSLVK